MKAQEAGSGASNSTDKSSGGGSGTARSQGDDTTKRAADEPTKPERISKSMINNGNAHSVKGIDSAKTTTTHSQCCLMGRVSDDGKEIYCSP